jgi:hypothetical protein
MKIIIAGICLFITVGLGILLSFVDMAGIVKIPLFILLLLVLISVYRLTRIQPKETKSGKDTGK